MNHERSNFDDSIIDEIHRVRAEIADRFHGDLKAICDDARARQTASGRKPVSMPPRRPQPRPSQAKRAG